MSADDNARAVVALEAMRPDVERGTGRCAILAAVDHCFANNLSAPEWLRLAFRRRLAALRACDFLTLDQAFGCWWPARTRQATERRNIVLRNRVHVAAMALIQADPSRPIRSSAFFEEVGATPGIHLSAGAAKARYYDALRIDGAINLDKFRCAITGRKR